MVLPDGDVVYSFGHSGGAKHDYVVPGARRCDGVGLDLGSECGPA